MEPLPTRRLVLSLYKSLLKIAVKYDKNIPCGKNPLFLMQREKDTIASPETLQMVCSLIREPFRANKELSNGGKITQKIQDAFNNLKILHQFYHPSISWITILSRKNIPFEEVLQTMCKFENPEKTDSLQHFNSMKQRVQSYLNKSKETTESASADQTAAQPQIDAETEGEIMRAQAAIRKLIGSLDEAGNEIRLQDSHTRAKEVMDTISRVMYKDMGFREAANGKYTYELQLSKALAGGAAPQSVLASTIIALAQHENVQLYSVVFSPGLKSMLRYSYLQDPGVCHESDIFMDPVTGEVLPGLRAVKPLIDRLSSKSNQANREAGGITGSNVVLVEHKNNAAFVLQMASSLAASKPAVWKEHLTVIEELKKQSEQQEPTQLFQFSSPSEKSKAAKTKKDSSPSTSSSSSTTTHPPSPPSPSSPSPSSPPSPPATTTPTSASYSLNPAKYFSSFFSFFSRRPKPAPPSRSAAEKTEKDKEEGGAEKGEAGEKGEKSKAPKIRSAQSVPPLPNHLRKYSRMWSHPSDLPNNPKTRRF